MNIKEAKKVISNMQIDGNHISCTLCVFEDERKCVDNNVDCQMKAIETVLAELEKKNNEVTKLKNNNKDLLRKLKNRVKDIKKLNKYSLYKKEFSTLNKQLEKKSKIINLMAEQLTTDIHSKEWVIDYYMSKIPIYSEKKIEEDK